MSQKIGIYTNYITGEFREFTEDENPKITTEQDRVKIKSIQEAQEKRYLMRLYNKELGNFIFIVFNYCNEFLNKELSQAEITRLVYMATYINYNGILVLNNSKIITKKYLKTLLKLSKTAFNDFYAKIINLQILKEEDDKLILNKEYFFKGSFKKYHELIKDKDYTRLYINAIRYLYDNTNKNKHKQLGIIFKLIPYINVNWNILCTNPEEENLELIKPLTLGDVLKILNYSGSKYLFEIRKFLLSLKLIDNTNIIALIETSTDIAKKKVCINPQIIYGGSKVDVAHSIVYKYFKE